MLLQKLKVILNMYVLPPLGYYKVMQLINRLLIILLLFKKKQILHVSKSFVKQIHLPG